MSKGAEFRDLMGDDSIMRTGFLKISTAAVLTGLIIAGCSASQDMGGMPAAQSGNDQDSQPSFSQFPDIPIPAGADMDVGRSLVLGSGEHWLGRLVLKTFDSPNSMFNFYKRKMPEHGWQEITSVRSTISVLTFSRGERVATIQIHSRTITGAESHITVSPRDRQAAPAGGPRGGIPGGTGAPSPGVQQLR